MMDPSVLDSVLMDVDLQHVPTEYLLAVEFEMAGVLYCLTNAREIERFRNNVPRAADNIFYRVDLRKLSEMLHMEFEYVMRKAQFRIDYRRAAPSIQADC